MNFAFLSRLPTKHWLLVGGLLGLGSCPAFAQEKPAAQVSLPLATLNAEVERLTQAGKYEEGVVLAEQALGQARAQLGEQHQGCAAPLNNLATIYEALGRYSQAEPLFVEALALRKKLLGEQHADYALSLNNLAGLYDSMGRYAEAEPLYVQALALRKQLLGDQHADYAETLNNLAGLYKTTARYTQAEPLYLAAIAIDRKQLGAQHPSYAIDLNNLGRLYEVMGRYAEAEPLYVQALAIRKQKLGEKHPSYLTGLNNLGAFYRTMGRFAQAERLYLKVLALRKQFFGEQHPDYAVALNNLGNLYSAQGRFAQAEPLYVQALAIRRQTVGEQHPAYAGALNNLAALYRAMGRYAEAEPLYVQALAIRKEKLGEQHPDYAQSLNNLAGLYESMRRYTQVEQLYITALAIKKQQLGEHHPEYATGLSNLAALYRTMGRYAEAEPLFTQVLAIREEKLGEQHPDYALSLHSLGVLYRLMERYTQAAPYCEQALNLRKHLLGEQHPDYAASLNAQALLYAATGRPEQAYAANAQATAVVRQHLRSTFPGLSEREKQQFLATVSNSTEIGHSLLLCLPPAAVPAAAAQAYDDLLFTKGLLLSGTAGMQRQLQASTDTALVRRFGEWQATKRRLAAALALPVAQQQKQGLDPGKLHAQANLMERELASRSATFRKGASLPTITRAQVQRTLRPGEAAIELVRYRWHRRAFTDTTYYSAFVLAPGRQAPQLVVLRNGTELERRYLPAYRRLAHATADARGAVEVGTAADAEAADAKLLYQAFWQPLAQALPPGTKTVYLSADGVYQQLNLNTLQNPTTGQFLLDELDVRLLGSTRELVQEPGERPAKGGEGVLVGAPSYRLPADAAGAPVAALGATNSAGSSRSNSLLATGEVPPLPGTAREVAEVDSLLAAAKWPRRRYTAAAATEEAVRDLRHPRVLHIATHGFFVPETRETGTLITPAQGAAAATTDPLLRSGLLLAGVSNFRDATDKPATEDGILTAYEASLLDLQGTELVVLSACETGLGQVQAGEGVYGLQRGFTVAGARSILMSLWKVDDAVTRELMAAFYKNWLGGNSKHEALRVAQRQVRQLHPDPYYWGAFVLVGE